MHKDEGAGLLKKINRIIKKMLYILNQPQKILCIFVFLLTCVGAILECIGVSAIVPLVNIVTDPQAVTTSEFVGKVSFLQHLSYIQIVFLIVGGIILLYLFKNAFFVLLSWVRVKFSCKIQREISTQILESYMNRGYQFFIKKDMGELTCGVNSDTTAVYLILYAGFRLLADMLTILLICIFMFFADWKLSLTMVLIALVCILLIYFVFRKSMHKAGVLGRKYTAITSQTLYETFQGIKDIFVLRKQRRFVEEYEYNQIEVQSAQCKQIVGQESPAYIIEGLCIAGLMLAVAFRIVSGNQSSDFVATLAAFAVGAFRILPSLGRISIALNQVMSCIPRLDSVYSNLVEGKEYEEAHPEYNFSTIKSTELVARPLRNRNMQQKTEYDRCQLVSRCKQHTFREKICLQDISFRYSNDTDNILENICLEIKKGQAIAFIGASGAGKSTLADIILGLLIPQEGDIFMDGKEIALIPNQWANTIGYVPQNVFLTSGSIRENIAFGEYEEEIDDNLVREALERAELSQFVATLPNGIETHVGDRGVRLSGGQRQRIAIARALYHQPEILVLDEATSALDNDTEATIMSAIDALQGQITLIIIAHRLTTVKNCDVIYEVKDKGISIREKAEIFS